MKNKQLGGLGSWIFIILVFGLVFFIGFKIIPLYIDHNNMSNVLDSMAREDGMAGKAKYTLKKTITKKFIINNIRDFPVEDNIEIKRTKNGTEIVMDYEVRMNLFKNLDLIAHFNKSVELRN
tara:strand:- start:83 stop:448 length:366 start_codon:yes stop_codon:yes gene_type:complete